MTEATADTKARLAALRSRRTCGAASAHRPPTHPAAKARLAATGLGLMAVSGLTVALASAETDGAAPTPTESATEPVVVVVRYADEIPTGGETTPVSVVELAAQPTVRVAASSSSPAATTQASG